MRRRTTNAKGPSAVLTERLECRQLLCGGQMGVFVNAGGPSYLDAAQNSWAADSGFTGGTESTGNFQVNGTTEQALYDTNRFGSNFSFSADADSGGYTLTLLFAEPVMNKVGMRVFNVFAQGKEILKNFDLVRAGGYQTAISKSFPVTITDNELDLNFQGVVNNALVAAIELVPLPIAPAAVTGLSATADSASQVTVNWTQNSNNEFGFEVDRSPDGKSNWQDVGSVGVDAETYVDTTVAPGTTYNYRVQAVGNYGSSPFTGPVSVTTPGQAPTAAPLATVVATQSLIAAPAATDAQADLTATPAADVGNTIQKITWTQLTGAAQSPVGRTEAETATVNGKIYCFGGYTSSNLIPQAVSDVYDPVSGTWSPLPNMPIGETHAGTCTDGRYIYMAGGYTGPGGAGDQIFAVTNVFRFDTQTNTWSSIQPLPAARGAGSLVLLGDTLHFMGGTDLARQDQTTHWSLDLSNPNATWQLQTPLNQARNHLGGVALNGKIYVVAGQQHQDPNFTTVGTVEIYDPTTGQWTYGASLPVTRSHIAGATFVYNGQIIVLGGDHTYLHDVTNVSSYDPIANKWTDLTPLPIARSSGCASVINGVFYYMTGNISKNCYKGTLTLSAPVNPPATPASESAVANSATQIKVTWSGVTGASSYQILRNTDGSTTFTGTPVVVQDTGAASYSYLDNTVSPNKQYFYEVLAVNSAGTSPPPAIEPSATTPALPIAPTGLTIANATTNEIDLRWNAVTGATSYVLRRSPTGTSGWSSLSPVTPGAGATQSYSDLTVSPANTYFYEVSVTTAAGTSLPSGPAVSATTLPVAPGGFAFSAVNSDEIDLTWNAVNGAQSYDLQTSPTGLPGSWTDNSVTPSGNSTESYSDLNLSSLTGYFYQLDVTTAVGTSAFSAPINTVTAPPTPTGLQVTNFTTTEVDLSWNAIAGATNYILQRSTSGLPNSWSNLQTVIPSGNPTETYADTTVTGPAEYFYRFSATVPAGVSAPTDSVNATIPPTVPVAPMNLAVSNIQSNQVTLSWSESSSTITGFTIQASTDDATWGAPVNVGNVSTTNITGLTPNQTYYFRICANNTTVSSGFTTTINPIQTPVATKAVTVIVDDKAATLVGTWTSGNTTSGFYGTDYLSDGDAHGGKSATFTPNLAAAGNYQVFARWTAAASRATNVPIDILSTAGTKTVTENQQQNGGTWVSLGTYSFNAGTAGSVTIRDTSANGYVIADAVEFVPVGAAAPATVIVDDTAATKVGTWTSSITTSGYYGVDYLSDGDAHGGKSVTFTPNLPAAGTYNVYARWTAAASRATNVPIDIVHQGTTTTVTVNQQQNGGVWFLLGTFTFDAGTGGFVTIRDTNANGYVIADAVEFVPN